tara:strand:- start:1590 stop:2420 length:831 start_codon:yes stop_codon:yes gene_type:complete
MASIISASTTSGTALNMSADTTGVLQLATGATPTTALTIDTSQNVGIGTTSPAAKLNVATGSGTLAQNIVTIKGGGSSGSFAGLSVQSNSGDEIFNVNNLTYNVTMGTVAGSLLVGTTGAASFDSCRVAIDAASDVFRVRSNSGFVFRFFAAGTFTTVGSIQTTASATSYNTSSDYRLKENIVPMTGALDKVSALKPVTYKWKIDGSNGQGFIAHELAEVIPDCVSGEKDAVDDEGNPSYQGVDTSFLVATLTAAIQEQQTIINDLKSRIETLETK